MRRVLALLLASLLPVPVLAEAPAKPAAKPGATAQPRSVARKPAPARATPAVTRPAAARPASPARAAMPPLGTGPAVPPVGEPQAVTAPAGEAAMSVRTGAAPRPAGESLAAARPEEAVRIPAPQPKLALPPAPRPPLPACPPTLEAIPEGVQHCRCAPSATGSGLVFGSGPYAGGSATCRAGLHAGVIGPRGGDLVIRVLPLPGESPGGSRNGVIAQPAGWTAAPGGCCRRRPDQWIGPGTSPRPWQR
jgi:hypothetical protein